MNWVPGKFQTTKSFKWDGHQAQMPPNVRLTFSGITGDVFTCCGGQQVFATLGWNYVDVTYGPTAGVFYLNTHGRSDIGQSPLSPPRLDTTPPTQVCTYSDTWLGGIFRQVYYTTPDCSGRALGTSSAQFIPVGVTFSINQIRVYLGSPIGSAGLFFNGVLKAPDFCQPRDMCTRDWSFTIPNQKTAPCQGIPGYDPFYSGRNPFYGGAVTIVPIWP